MGSGCFGHLPYDQLQVLRKRRRYGRKDATAVVKTRLAPQQGQNLSRTRVVDDTMETSVTGVGKRGRPPANMVDLLNGRLFCRISVVCGMLFE